MAARPAVESLAVAALVVVGMLVLGGRAEAALLEGGVEFQDGAGNTKQSIQPGKAAIFYVKDASLGTVQAATATWTEVPSQVPANTWWSLATGAPHPDAFTLDQGTSYDADTPSNTPLASVPTASVNGVPFSVSNLNAATGEFALLNDVNGQAQWS